ncbi:hypothetical protein DY000_02052737 [Brassica cretica]|uniref:Uncharacterized protein n=1 Tax=Brassica cretica TaxID=69181 RepID=A0ABQ7A864_BRACR|nr:hypothetical protein DY000_02052737 [Brassica cretica]
MCQVRASYNAIRLFITDAGILITDPIEMSQLAIMHFQSILGAFISTSSLVSPDPPPRPSLKRSRSSPTFSPSLTTNPNPFTQKNTDPVLSLSFLSQPASQNFLGLTSSNQHLPSDFNSILLLPDSQFSIGDPLLPPQ